MRLGSTDQVIGMTAGSADPNQVESAKYGGTGDFPRPNDINPQSLWVTPLTEVQSRGVESDPANRPIGRVKARLDEPTCARTQALCRVGEFISFPITENGMIEIPASTRGHH